MRILSFILFVGVALAVGCFLDASSPTAQAINCDNVCNAHRVKIHCKYVGLVDQNGNLWQPVGVEYYIPHCDTNVFQTGPCTYTVIVNGKKVTKTYSSLAQFDTSTASAGSCGRYLYHGNQQHPIKQGSLQACPCPCTPLNPPPCGGDAYNPGWGCPDVEGVYPGIINSSLPWGVCDLNSCQ
jgi:hypothetical protein